MVTAEEVENLLVNLSQKDFLDRINAGTELLDYRSKVLVSHLWVEQLMEYIIIKKFKNYEDITDFDFSRKRKILFGLGIINEDMNHELKILNQIRVEFAHKIYPLQEKVPNLIKKFKMYTKLHTNKNADLLSEDVIFGMITGIVTRYLVEILWGLKSDDKKK